AVINGFGGQLDIQPEAEHQLADFLVGDPTLSRRRQLRNRHALHRAFLDVAPLPHGLSEHAAQERHFPIDRGGGYFGQAEVPPLPDIVRGDAADGDLGEWLLLKRFKAYLLPPCPILRWADFLAVAPHNSPQGYVLGPLAG